MPSATAKRKAIAEEPLKKQSRGIKIQKAAPTPEPSRSVTPALKPAKVADVVDDLKEKPRGVKLKDRIQSEEPKEPKDPKEVPIKQEIKAEQTGYPIVKLEDVKIKEEMAAEASSSRVEYTPESKPKPKPASTAKQSTRGGTPPVKPPKQIPAPEPVASTADELVPTRMRNAKEIKDIKAEIQAALNLDRGALRKLCEKPHNKAKLTGEGAAEFEMKLALECAQARYEQGRHTGCRFPEFKGFITPVKGGNHAAHIAGKEARMDRQLANMIAVSEEEEPLRPAMKTTVPIERLTPSQCMTPQAWDASYGKASGSSKAVPSREVSRTMTPDWRDCSVTRTSASYTPQPDQPTMASWELKSPPKPASVKWEWQQPGGWTKLVAMRSIKVEAGGKRKLDSIEELEAQQSLVSKKSKLV